MARVERMSHPPPGGWPQVRTDAGARKIVERLDSVGERIDDLSEKLTERQEGFEKTVIRRINLRPRKWQVVLYVGTALVAAGGIVLGVTWKLLTDSRTEVRSELQTFRTEVRADIKDMRDVVMKMATTPKPEAVPASTRRPRIERAAEAAQ